MNITKGQLLERDDGGFGSWPDHIFKMRPTEDGVSSPRDNSDRSAQMVVSQIMRRQVARLDPHDTLQKAASVLRDEDVTELPICVGPLLVGLVTERCLAIRGMAEGADPLTTPLDQIMEECFFYCFEDQPCAVARKLMSENHLNRLPVTDSAKRLVGMVNRADLAH